MVSQFGDRRCLEKSFSASSEDLDFPASDHDQSMHTFGTIRWAVCPSPTLPPIRCSDANASVDTSVDFLLDLFGVQTRELSFPCVWDVRKGGVLVGAKRPWRGVLFCAVLGMSIVDQFYEKNAGRTERASETDFGRSSEPWVPGRLFSTLEVLPILSQKFRKTLVMSFRLVRPTVVRFWSVLHHKPEEVLDPFWSGPVSPTN